MLIMNFIDSTSEAMWEHLAQQGQRILSVLAQDRWRLMIYYCVAMFSWLLIYDLSHLQVSPYDMKD